MKQRTKDLHLRVTGEQLEKLEAKMQKLGLNTPRKRSAYIRYRIFEDDLQPVASDQSWKDLIQAFADMARVGGNLT